MLSSPWGKEAAHCFKTLLNCPELCIPCIITGSVGPEGPSPSVNPVLMPHALRARPKVRMATKLCCNKSLIRPRGLCVTMSALSLRQVMLSLSMKARVRDGSLGLN